MVAEGITCTERLRPAADGIDFGVCVPRDLQDVCLVEAAREQGADVRERCTFASLHWRAGRVAGVRYTDEHGDQHDISATLVVGADGRRSSVAAQVGAWSPYRLSRNGRGLVFRYLDDPQAGTRAAETYIQWREGDSFAFAFPSAPEGRLLILLMGHRDEVSEARRDPEGYWQRKLDEHPGLAAPRRRRGREHLHQAALDRRDAGLLPRLVRAGLGAGRRRRALQGPGHRAGHARRDVDGPHARRARPAGARRPGRDRPGDAHLGGRARPRLPARLPLRQPRHARRAPVPGAVRAGARRRADHGARPHRPLRPRPHAAGDRAAAAPGPRRSSPRCGGASGRAPRRSAAPSRDLRTELEIRRERRADRFRATRTVTGSDHPGCRVARAAAAPRAARRAPRPSRLPPSFEEVPA